MSSKKNNAQEVTTVATVTTNNNGTDIVTTTARKFDFTALGYESSALERGENGGIMVVLKDSNGDKIEKEIFVEDTTAYDAVKAYAELRDFEKLSDLAKCYNIAKSAPIAKASGYKSVGQFLAENFGVDSSTANNYKTIGELFLHEVDRTDENGQPVYDEQGNKVTDITWIRSWCKGYKVANINQSLSIIRKCKDEQDNISIDVFFEQYVKTGKLSLDGKLSLVKEQCRKITGKDSKDSKDSKEENKAEKPKQTLAAIWATVKENIYGLDLSEQEIELMNSAARSIEQIMEAHKEKH